MQNLGSKIRSYSDFVVLPHSVFALPFAVSGLLLGTFPTGQGLSTVLLVQVIACVVFARSAAMGFNRLVDLRFDKKNPRTSNRPLVTGRVTWFGGVVFTALASVLFLGTVYLIGWHCFVLSPLVLVVLFFYSFTKRFTSCSHLVLGVCLGLAPAAAWYVVRPEVSLPPILLGLSVTCWVAGFDLLYSLQDVEFDRENNMYSFPARFGVDRSLLLSRLLHVVASVGFIGVGLWMAMGSWYFLFTVFGVLLLLYEHSLVSCEDLSRIDRAFFTVNGFVSIVFFIGVLIEYLLLT